MGPVILVLNFYLDPSQHSNKGSNNRRAGSKASLKRVHFMVFSSNKFRTLELPKYYDVFKAYLIGDLAAPNVTWGLERRLLPLEDQGQSFQQLVESDDRQDVDVVKSLNQPTFKAAPLPTHRVYKSGLISKLSFVSHLHFGHENVYVNGDHVGVIARTTDATSDGVDMRPSVDAILKVIYQHNFSITLQTYSKHRSTIQMSQNSRHEARLFEEVILAAFQLCKIIRDLLVSRETLPSRISEHRVSRRYEKGLRLDEWSLRSLARNPTDLKAQPYSRFLEPKVVNIPSPRETYALKENLQLLTVSRQVQAQLSVLLERGDIAGTCVKGVSEALSTYIGRFAREYDLTTNGVELNSPPRRYLTARNPTLKSAGLQIMSWARSLKPDLSGREDEQLRFVPLLDRLWEQFCQVRIAEALINRGFVPDFSKDKTMLFYQEDTLVEIACDVDFSPGMRLGGIYFAKPYNKLRPDFTISVTRGAECRVGVLDPKFSPNLRNWAARGEKIFEEYGAWFRRLDGSAIDYVYAMVPTTEHSKLQLGLVPPEDTDSAKGVSLSFGFVAVAMKEEDSVISELLADILLGDLATESTSLQAVS